jgi:hypothetical protein
VVEPAVVAQGDDAGGVDSVVADPVVGRVLVGAGEGFGPGVKCVLWRASAEGAVGPDGVVVGAEFIEQGLQLGDGVGGPRGGEAFFEGLVEAFDLAAGLGDTGGS